MKYPVKTPFNPGMLVVVDAAGAYFDAAQVVAELNASHEPFSEHESVKQMAAAWTAVFTTLSEVAPNWLERSGTGQEKAIAEIRDMAMRATVGGIQSQVMELLTTSDPVPYTATGMSMMTAGVARWTATAKVEALEWAATHCDETARFAARQAREGGTMFDDGREHAARELAAEIRAGIGYTS